MQATTDVTALEQALEEARQALVNGVDRELDLREASDFERAEMVNFELTFHQREAHCRRHIELVAKHAAQQRETRSLHAEYQRILRGVALAKGLAIVPRDTVTAAMAAAMDETMEAA